MPALTLLRRASTPKQLGSPQNPATDAHHLAYEIEALARAAKRYSETWDETQGATPPELPDAIFYLEASLLHARNLLEVLLDGSSAVNLGDLGLHSVPDTATIKSEIRRVFGVQGGRIYGDLSTHLVHLSPKRKIMAPTTNIDEPRRLATTIITMLDDLYARPGNAAPADVTHAIAAARQDLHI